MCVYCVIGDFGNRWIPKPQDSIPFIPHVPVQSPWTPEMLAEWRDIIARVKAMEERLMELGEQMDCVEDPSKLDYLDDIQRLLDKAKARRGKHDEQ